MATSLTLSSAEKFEKVCQILDQHERMPSRLIPILQAVQEQYRYLPEDVMTFIATSLDSSPAHVFGVASFYSRFALKPKGKYVLRLCDGTACHVKRSIPIIDALRESLGLDAQHATTPDLMYTVETVACLGACGLAPAVVVNDEVHGLMTPDKALALLEQIGKAEQD